MVTPFDLLALAEELSHRADEASLRCAASRAYFAAFLHCRNVASSELGFSPTGFARDHLAIRRAIGESNAQAAARLENLRKERNRADYEVDEDFGPGPAQEACRTARILISTL